MCIIVIIWLATTQRSSRLLKRLRRTILKCTEYRTDLTTEAYNIYTHQTKGACARYTKEEWEQLTKRWLEGSAQRCMMTYLPWPTGAMLPISFLYFKFPFPFSISQFKFIFPISISQFIKRACTRGKIQPRGGGISTEIYTKVVR